MKLNMHVSFFFSKNTQLTNLMKIRRVGVELFSADGRTDGRTEGKTEVTKIIVVFRNFANARKNYITEN